MSTADDLTQTVADELGVIAAVVRYFEAVDDKDWEHFDDSLTEDSTAQWVADSVIQGRAAIVAALEHMLQSDEVVTFHLVGAMQPVIDGDTATVTARVRAMHHGLGAREGKFYESFGRQPTQLVRTPDGWRISHHDWHIIVKHGDLNDLFAPEIAAGKKY